MYTYSDGLNNTSATFIIMIQISRGKLAHSFHDFNFHNILSSIYKVLNHKNNNYYIISKLSEINVFIMNMTTTINILPKPIIMLQQCFFIYFTATCVPFKTIFSSAFDII